MKMSKEMKITEPIIDLKNNRVFYDSIIDLNHKLELEREYLIGDIQKLIERKDITNESLRKGKVSKRLRQYEKFIIKVDEDYRKHRKPF
tara:strand:- start:110 stop:376 length:267 start_codon:yes stop_codon:yes gene_type:complete